MCDPYGNCTVTNGPLSPDSIPYVPGGTGGLLGASFGSGPGHWSPLLDLVVDESGGGDGSDGDTIGAVPQGLTIRARKPVVCNGDDLIWNSLEFSLKFGVEANVGNVLKIGASFFKNLTTGETGGSAGIKVLFGYEVGTKNPPNVPLTVPVGKPTHSVSLGPIQHNITLNKTDANLSLSFVPLIGGEVTFDLKKFRDSLRKCDHVY